MENKKKVKRRGPPLSGIYLVAVLVLMYLPTVAVVVYSFNASKLDAVWAGFTLSWYEQMLSNSALMTALRNSLILALSSCGISAVVGTLGAIGMARSKLRSRGLISVVSALPIMTPEIVLGMGFLAFFSLLGLKFGMLTLIIAHCSFCIPYIFIIVSGRLKGLDPSLAEAARDLGAGEARMFWDITLPLISPAILSGTLLSFAMSLDDVVISFFVTGAGTNTLPIKIYSQLKLGVTPEINALSTVILVITFIVVGIAFRIGSPRKHNHSKPKEDNTLEKL